MNLAPGGHSIVAVQWNIFFQVSPRTVARLVKVPPPPIPKPPVITKPDPGETLPSPVTFSGTGYSSNLLVLLLDQGTEPLGYVQMENGIWNVPLNLAPGGHSIVAVQWNIFFQVSPRTVARLVKVPPPSIAAVQVTFPAVNQVRFSGEGYTGASVDIIIKSGPGGTPPPLSTVTGGNWTGAVTDWPPGTYNLEAIQQVPDNGGGWVKSSPYPFTVELKLPELPDPTDLKHDVDYQPTFSGNGTVGATVRLYNPGGASKAAPDALVGNNGEWSSRASEVWGPTLNREVHIKQYKDSQESPNWKILTVTIPPEAAVMNVPVENGLSPDLSGTCWATATLQLTYSDSPTRHPVTNNNGVWRFRRDLPFEPDKTHTATIIQTVANQNSPPASRDFVVRQPMEKPTITKPLHNEEVDSDVTVLGKNGMAGASMQLWDARDKKPLGDPVTLNQNGDWAINLKGLVIDAWFITARQTLNNRPSEHSEIREFKVVVMPPEFLVPQPGNNLPRTSILSGKGRPNGRVTVWCKGIAEPLLRDVLIGPTGVWEGSVTQEVGEYVFWATQTFEGKTSKPSLEVPCRFVPHAVLAESPTPEERLGKTVTVSGFGFPGDRITLKRGNAALGEAPVLPDRTWSITATLAPPDGAVTLSLVASSGDFHSAPSEWVSQLGLYLPEFTRPVAGQWGSPAMTFAGLGKPGSGTLMSWYNPEVEFAARVAVTQTGWTTGSTQPLTEGGHWCRFWQSFSTGTPISDCSESGRFDVRIESSDKQ
ncbi:hypothetical protein [Pseudomonas sp. COW5]|uniref:hypothetical protein n=1 Tax=Pseudomonas sp. COW5 TaxID=2981253 RepID=UPI0022476D8D|nr:hypothetical protein [Pseudomonas sp. COW5]MCX2544696.1 hypothetical protein [Pseudomonas sp. COW5]